MRYIPDKKLYVHKKILVVSLKKLKCALKCIPYRKIKIVEKENILWTGILMSSLCARPSSQSWSGDILVYIEIK